MVALMANVERLVIERRDAEALRLWSEAAALLPEHPLVLHERARRLALGGEAAAAREVLERIIAAAPGHVPFLLSLAAVLRTLGEREELAEAPQVDIPGRGPTAFSKESKGSQAGQPAISSAETAALGKDTGSSRVFAA